VERRLRVTRSCLEVLAEFRNPVSVITKNHLVTRDIDLLAGLAGVGAAAVFLSITTLDDDLRVRLEPRTSSPSRRFEAIRELAAAGIPAGVMVAPVIPGLNEHEIPAILERAREAGATQAGYIVLRLPHGVKELFADWLREHVPHREKKILNRVRALRGGRLNDPRFGSRMRGEGFHAGEIAALFRLGLRRAGLERRRIELAAGSFRRPAGPQIELFGGPP
jgi:DNA repair photolyase